eukprot:PhM_4_TR2720/c0_g1_i1/m.105223/K00914/PIK3C3, VPS34; phosphatidylinositol 3-kinase
MTTTEAFITDCLYEQKPYDVFGTLDRTPQYTMASDISGSVRVKVAGVDGWVGQTCDVYCVVTLYAVGQQLCLPLTTSHSTSGDTVAWDSWLTFPVTYAELPLDTLLCVDVFEPEKGLVGGTSAHLFSARGKLKRGFRRYRLHKCRESDGSEASTTLGKFTTPDWEDMAHEFHMKRIPAVPWMDKLTNVRLSDLSAQRPLETHEMYLLVEFPIFSRPVFYSSELVTEGLAAALAIPTGHANMTPVRTAESFRTATDVVQRAMPYYDPDMRHDNPCESMATILSKSTHRLLEGNAKPSPNQLSRIQAIIRMPPIAGTPLSTDQVTLLWQFGTYLTRDSAAFVRFMEIVDWKDSAESTQAASLAQKWAPISLGDALALLSREFLGVSVMRRHAIGVLEKASDSELAIILLQLVQAIRYEDGTESDKADGELVTFLLSRCCTSWDLTCRMYWYVTVEMSIEATRPAPVPKLFQKVRAALLQALTAHDEGKDFVARLKKQEDLRKVLQQLNLHVRTFPAAKQVEALKHALASRSCGLHELLPDDLAATQTALSMSLRSTAAATTDGTPPSSTRTPPAAASLSPAEPPLGSTLREKENSKDKDNKETKGFNLEGVLHAMQSMAANVTGQDGAPGGGSGGGGRAPVMHPLRSDFPITSIDPTKGIIFKSAKRPMGLWFTNNDDSYAVMYKAGDDIRQDQLVIQMIQLMDRLLKEDGLDLKLTPYRVLALSYDDGFVEMVPDVKTLQDVGSAGGVQTHLRSFPENVTATGELKPHVMENFVNSCAGYCVITFILGIGDRHLENLLVTRDGRLLHIDFGFILGKDPKLFPAAMKLSREMIDGMGGLDTRHYEQFKIHCCSAFNSIRKHSSMIMNLFMLMLDAEIPQLNGEYKNADPKLNLLKVQDKLRLDLNDADAIQYLQQVITESANALFSAVWDRLHETATKLRS